jgi:hypothetical protein
MGVQASPNGVFLKFVDVNGNPDPSRPAVFGKLAALFGKTRPDHPGDPDPVFGSPEWLTDLLVANDTDDLADLPHRGTLAAYTSGSSKSVSVQWDATDVDGQDAEGSLDSRMTIAVGYPLPPTAGHTQPAFMVEGFLVLPPETSMNPTHKLWQGWLFGGQYLTLDATKI